MSWNSQTVDNERRESKEKRSTQRHRWGYVALRYLNRGLKLGIWSNRMPACFFVCSLTPPKLLDWLICNIDGRFLRFLMIRGWFRFKTEQKRFWTVVILIPLCFKQNKDERIMRILEWFLRFFLFVVRISPVDKVFEF